MKTQPDIWKRISSTQIADCRVFSVRKDVSCRNRDQAKHNFFVIENPNWVNIIALTPQNQVVLIEQFRHGTEEVILEIPGGMVDDGEEPETAAVRELAEETGYETEKLIFLGNSHPNPALQGNTIHHFLAVDCKKTQDVNFDEHESICTRLVGIDDVKNLVAEGEITHALAIAGFYYLALYENKI